MFALAGSRGRKRGPAARHPYGHAKAQSQRISKRSSYLTTRSVPTNVVRLGVTLRLFARPARETLDAISQPYGKKRGALSIEFALLGAAAFACGSKGTRARRGHFDSLGPKPCVVGIMVNG